ncbi:MAG: DUF2183 domain-containing protein [Xanthomonadaceae bacterium]|nr:DUF2183 domain-containing protein [Xanthomonadaceae bacterium]
MVTDIDDTLKVSRIISRGERLDQAHQLLLETDAFSGSRTLLDALDREGAEIVYLSAAPRVVSVLQKKFLKKNHFPQREHLILKSSPRADSFAYKVRAVSELVKSHPGFEFIFIGDNAEKDVAAYAAVTKANPTLTIHTFIHELYAGKPSAPITRDQTAFLTFAEVSVYLASLGIIGNQLPNLLEQETLSDLDNCKTKELALPEYVEINTTDLDRLESDLPFPLTNLFQKLRMHLNH